MRIFHTADWHLGKVLQGVSLIDEQRFVLEQFISAVRSEKPDAVIIAGDLYDRSVPPAEAVSLLDEVLWTLTVECRTPVLAISGNHDSPARLQFGSRLMQSTGLHIAGRLGEDGTCTEVELADEYGKVVFHLIPFADPSIVRNALQDHSVTSHQQAMDALIRKIGGWDAAERHVAIAHAFVTPHGGPEDNTSDSERPLSIGGTEYVAAELFSRFNYTALGHLHQAHHVGTETIRYAGSPMKYSISEENHKKGFLVIEMDAEGSVKVEKRPLQQKRDIRSVKAALEDLLQMERSDDYIFVKLLDQAPILSPMEKIRSVFPNALHVERIISRGSAGSGENHIPDLEQLDDRALFRAFYEEMTGNVPDKETEAIMDEALQELLTGKEGGR